MNNEKKEEQPLNNMQENEKIAIGDIKANHDDDFEERYKQMPITEDTSCGMGFLRGPVLQRSTFF